MQTEYEQLDRIATALERIADALERPLGQTALQAQPRPRPPVLPTHAFPPPRRDIHPQYPYPNIND